MDWNSYNFGRDDVYPKLKELGYTHLSHSQIATFNACEWKWKKTYGEKIKEKSVSIELIFGTAMHYVIQEWLTCMYSQSAKKANEMNLVELLKSTLIHEYKQSMIGRTEHYSNAIQLREYTYYGQEILNELIKRRTELFPLRDHTLLGIELPLIVDVDESKKIVFTAFLDIVLKNTKTDEITIIDLKTSRQGWNDKKKKDDNTKMQLLLYKKYFSLQYNVPIEKINVLYLILKRILYSHSDFEQKRIQKFIPASGSVSLKKASIHIERLINHSFNEDGTYNLNNTYKKIKNKTICQYCVFHKTEHCNWKDD